MKISCKICFARENLIKCEECQGQYCGECFKWAHSKDRLFPLKQGVCEGIEKRSISKIPSWQLVVNYVNQRGKLF